MEQLKCTESECGENATYTYAWPWPDGQGACCGAHQSTISQRAANLGREAPQLVAVAGTGAPVVLSRDERIGYNAKILTLEEEVNDQKKYAGELYTQNANLSSEVARLTSRTVNLERSIDSVTQEKDAAIRERDEARAAAADASREVANLKLLLPVTPPEHEPTTRSDKKKG